ncbi:MAG: hypothetical protein LBK62_06615 [Treponema sp.]|nr:hypothetical protein [Treponema sp.]
MNKAFLIVNEVFSIENKAFLVVNGVFLIVNKAFFPGNPGIPARRVAYRAVGGID